jgi:hypothetical protein
VTFTAALVPVLFTVIVTVMFSPSVTLFGDAEIVAVSAAGDLTETPCVPVALPLFGVDANLPPTV